MDQWQDNSGSSSYRGSKREWTKDELSCDFSRRSGEQPSEEFKAKFHEADSARISTNLDAKRNEFTLNKLRFERLGLCGRDHEMEILKNCLQCCQSQGTKELVTLHGLSGTGKSALAAALGESELARKGITVSGKCNGQPYDGISSACQQMSELLLNLLQANDAQAVEMLRELVLEKQSFSHLVKLMPALKKIRKLLVTSEDDSSTDSDSNAMATPGNCDVPDLTSQQAKNQMHYCLCQFFQSSSSCLARCNKTSACILLILDDVQWMDPASLDLLQVLLKDRQNPNGWLIVVSYRSNEVSDSHPFSKTFSELRQDTHVRLTDIPVGNLTPTSVNHVLIKLLSIEDTHQAQALADLCYKRTDGNIFFLCRFLAMLEKEQLLQFHFGLMTWKWDISLVEEKTSVTANVVDLLRAKMYNLAPPAQQLLSLASFLGNSFEVSIMSLVWDAFHHESSSKEEDVSLLTWISVAINESFLEQDGPSGYRWVHDKVREAASLLMPQVEAVTTQCRLGLILSTKLDQTELDSTIFLVTNLLNMTSNVDLTEDKKSNLAKWNLHAAVKAKQMSAFESAATYCAKGLRFLTPKDAAGPIWEDTCFQLLLDLYSLGAQAELAVGGSKVAETYCNEVLKQKTCSIMDKLRVYHVLLESMGSGGRPKEAIQLAFDVLRQLGCKFSSNSAFRTVQAGSSLLRITAPRNIPTTSQVLELRKMTDPSKIECMKILDTTATFAYLSGNIVVFLLLFGRLVDWTLKYGLCPSSPAAFGMAGFLSSHIKGNYTAGMKWGDLALLALDAMETKATQARCSLFVDSLVRAWVNPLKSTLKPLVIGYKAGLRWGDTVNACWCLYQIIHNALLSGAKLSNVKEDCEVYSLQMQSLKQKQCEESTKMTLQAVLNLTGGAEECTSQLQGGAFDEVKYLSQDKSEIVSISFDHFNAMKSYLHCYLGEHEQGAELALQKGDSCYKNNPGGPIGGFDCFTRALSLYATAQKRKKGWRKYRREAVKARSTVKFMVMNGNPNATHLLKLLDAEHKALGNSKQFAVTKCYQEAITLAGRGGFVQDVALANERYAIYLLGIAQDGSLGERQEARFRLDKAAEYYMEWGATGKASLLSKQFAWLPSTTRQEWH